MSVKSKNSMRKNRKSDLARPFDGKILDDARHLAEKYQVILSQEDDIWLGRGLELPTAFGDGKNPDECIASTREALVASVATMLEMGQCPPSPAGGKRTVQVNVRMTPEEKVLLENTAKANGFRGVGDFMRTRALNTTR